MVAKTGMSVRAFNKKAIFFHKAYKSEHNETETGLLKKVHLLQTSFYGGKLNSTELKRWYSLHCFFGLYQQISFSFNIKHVDSCILNGVNLSPS